ncbi:DUF4870 domain-containing protein [Actinoplanes sp. NPDC051513]|uniref:DUF4870 domain-containing protein n=1 Tax=Actinoplanes sp. NPDC051513 TaxID=3363908 RepID=UPI0037AA89BD
MTEPPRPPGEGNPYAANDPTSGSTPPPSSPPPPPPGGYAPPPSGGYGPPSGGYNQPPGGYPPPGGYNPPSQQYGYGPQPGGSTDDRTWILVAHFGGAAGAFLSGSVAGWIAPLVALLARGNQSPHVRAEAVKALNFQILWSIVGFIGYATWCIGIGFLITAAAWLISIIFGVIAGVKASNNEPYNYPMSVKIIK